MRHWPDPSAHPQLGSLPVYRNKGRLLTPSRLVRFSVSGSVPADELQAVSTAARRHRVLLTTDTSLEVEFGSLKDAMQAAAAVEIGMLKAGSFLVTAEFLR